MICVLFFFSSRRRNTSCGREWSSAVCSSDLPSSRWLVLAVCTISTPGTYTIRISQREDGSALDAFVLQLASLPEPDDPGPDESPIVGSPYVRITQQPKDSMVANNQTATFTVVASSTGTPTYQWQKASP